MAFGVNKKINPITFNLGEEQFCKKVSADWDSIKKGYKNYFVSASADEYTLLYQSGRFKGLPAAYGGKIYPFSLDPSKVGSKNEGKEIGMVDIIAIAKTTQLKVYWGTAVPFVFEDPTTMKPYSVSANGVFYVEIDSSDAARKADMFYRKIAKSRFDREGVLDTEAVRDFLREAFIMNVGTKIEEHINASGRSLANCVALPTSEIKKISEELCPTIKDIFGEYGLSIVVQASSGSILMDLKVEEFVR